MMVAQCEKIDYRQNKGLMTSTFSFAAELVRIRRLITAQPKSIENYAY